ncbi:MAG TPA: hypothetical protein VL068_04685 [Microthrixaceae bacterium]|nr:hypothetical protein [Microthrixaceae bacterium]
MTDSPAIEPPIGFRVFAAAGEGDLELRLVDQVDSPGADRGPWLIGIAGSVAVGKTNLAARLAEAFTRRSPQAQIAVLSTDSFLLPNVELERLGRTMRKGFPESFDYAGMVAMLTDLRAGRSVDIAEYSHVDYDIVAGSFTTITAPDVVILEGVNVLQPSPLESLPGDGNVGVRTGVVNRAGAESPTVSDLLDRRIYIDTDEASIQTWFVDRFLELCASAAQAVDGSVESRGFYAGFAGMEPEAIRSIAEWTWSEINAKNLHQHILPSRAEADVIVEKSSDHGIRRLLLRT